jgi:manganese/zinc/iron transport system permease protein
MEEVEPFFFDPVIRGPLFACSLMGMLGAVIGVLVVFRRQSLVGEALSHACYPGMIVGAIVAQCLFEITSPTGATLLAFLGATVSSASSALAVHWLVGRRYASSDAALSFILAASFSTGLLLISALQPVYPSLWRSLQSLLIGQAATMQDRYVLLSFCLSTMVLTLVVICRRSIKVSLFDPDFAKLTCLTNTVLEWLFLSALVLTIIVSIRSMGVVLLSAMLIFPTICARLVSSKFEQVLVIAAIIGGACGFGGVLLSYECAMIFRALSGRSLWLPTGPLIVLLLAACFCAVFLFSPSEGLFMRLWRRRRFSRRCNIENILKALWKECSVSHTWTFGKDQLVEIASLPKGTIQTILKTLQKKELIEALPNGMFEITPQGIATGKKLVRLHRLWELYLVEYCGMAKERVHPSAEEMEHILTPDVERALLVALKNPLFDPHRQPIPTIEDGG